MNYVFLKILNTLLMDTSLTVSVCSSRQIVLEEDKGDNSRSARSSLLLDGYHSSNCLVMSAVHLCV